MKYMHKKREEIEYNIYINFVVKQGVKNQKKQQEII